jgi:hypothetical protein
MRELWLSLGFWMIFGLPSGETTRREKPSPSSDKPAAVQQATPARVHRAQRNAVAETPPADAKPKTDAKAAASESTTPAPQPETSTEAPAAPAAARQTCVLPPPTQVYH